MIVKAETRNIMTVWNRYEAMSPQCGFGDTGLCCRHCLQGPCRIDPFREGPQIGICGASADTIVASGLYRAIATGTAAHAGHAKHLAHTLKTMALGKTEAYTVKAADNAYHKLGFSSKGERLVGALFIGDIANAGLYRLVMRERMDVNAIKPQLIGHQLHYGHLLLRRGPKGCRLHCSTCDCPGM